MIVIEEIKKEVKCDEDTSLSKNDARIILCLLIANLIIAISLSFIWADSLLRMIVYTGMLFVIIPGSIVIIGGIVYFIWWVLAAFIELIKKAI